MAYETHPMDYPALVLVALPAQVRGDTRCPSRAELAVGFMTCPDCDKKDGIITSLRSRIHELEHLRRVLYLGSTVSHTGPIPCQDFSQHEVDDWPT